MAIGNNPGGRLCARDCERQPSRPTFKRDKQLGPVVVDDGGAAGGGRAEFVCAGRAFESEAAGELLSAALPRAFLPRERALPRLTGGRAFEE